MRFRSFLAIIFLFASISAYSQSTYFIKYKSSISKLEVNKIVDSRQILTSQTSHELYKADYSVTHFAENLGKTDPILSRIIKITFKTQAAADYFISRANSDPSIDYVQKSNIYKIEYTPNDSLYSQQWALKKIEASKAWDITQGADSIIIGLIDTGVDYLHPDLKNKIYINKGETGTDANGNDKRSNGIDDDRNGFIDDYMGWDFTDRKGFPFDSSGGDYLNWDNNPMDENGHGTYIAGILGAETNNLIGITGVAPKIKILNLRAFDPNGYGEEDDVAAAILYAVKMGANVINMSFGDTQFSYVLRDVIRYAYSKNVVLVASSGNDGSDKPHYPSGYSEVICVGNSTQNDYVASSSNYGSTLDLVAPGTSILTTSKDGGYTEVSGTSASAPFVSAAVGLILSLGNFKNEEVKQILKSTADDINEPGWDLKSGAGRLNLFRALSVVAPSIIKFNSPEQDYTTSGDSILVNATILSAYFQNYSLYLGTGLNPANWTELITNSPYQFSGKNIYNINATDFKDTVYTLRLVVDQSNGKNPEERVNFYIERTPPKTKLVFLGNAYYGSKNTILASVYTNQRSIVRLYYKKDGDKNFNFVTLDGFATNTQMVNQLHYGFIPKDLIQQNSSYQVYLEAVNMAGLGVILNNNGSNYNFSTEAHFKPAFESEQSFSLPPGEIYQNPVNLTSPDSSEIFLRENVTPKISYLYKLNGNKFNKIDSLQNKIVRDFGDFNKNGKKDLLTYFINNGYIEEQQNTNSSTIIQKYADTTGALWPISADDLYGDGKTEILSENTDTSIAVWHVNDNLSLNNPVILPNFTPAGIRGNWLDFPHAVITDMNNDGKKEIWMVDAEGDIYDYNVLGPGNFKKGIVISTNFNSSSAYLTSGDYTGNSKKDMAVLLQSIPSQDIAPYYRLVIFNIVSDSLNVIFDNTFIDPSTEFNSSFQKSENSIRFADIDNDGADELILFTFPYSYIFKYDAGKNDIISYKENINSNSVFVGDINHDGVKDVAFPTKQGIKFYEFTGTNRASTPYDLAGYSVDSTKIILNWYSDSNKFIIYRGLKKDSLIKYDSTLNTQFIDQNVDNKTYYYYAVQSMDYAKRYPFSNLSSSIKVYAHNPAHIINAKSINPNAIVVNFSDRMNNTIENLQSFYILGSGYPNSVSANNQFSYLLSFNNGLSAGMHQLIVNNLNDFYGSPVKHDTINFIVDSIHTVTKFFVNSHEIVNPYKVKITFNLPVDPAAALNTSNYSFNPSNGINNVQLADNNQTVYLDLSGHNPVGSIGIEYTLHIENLKSSVGSGNLKINSGAGSYIVLTSYANNLSGVYVYPSPVKIQGGEGKMTFANLPKNAKITIFNIDGKKINELSENNGDGGLQYNLKDLNGNILNSGVYIFRIVRLDDSNNEIEEKIGKFAVIK